MKTKIEMEISKYPGRPVAVTIEDNQAVLQQWASQEAAHNATEVSR